MKFLICIVVLFPLPAYSQAQGAALFFAGTEMRLGMPKASVIERLRGHYDLRSIKDDAWLVHEKGSEREKRYVGQVGFTKEVLTYVAKDWFQLGDKFTLVEALYAVTEQMGKRGETVARIKTSTVKEPGLSFQEIALQFTNRAIVIFYADDSKSASKQVTITEILSTAPYHLFR